ncbi:ATP-binding protein [Ruminococcus gauvreauii]|uniref:ATP-binding protein n=1 Tax=Ruminococcus gauvreauii TaxID=438033 RepID=A0ABY5VLP2_9FIRM|nr:ATP-binding protein [Ruminococcus gauvreauii]UWP61126.1 ATP-binding protein [Ruminococcus gauvreauii]
MDKTEYQIKLDQINELVDKQDFEGALEIVDTIDWRRVKSVRTLCMVADIYEVNDRLDDSKRILLLAYKRSSIGKIILYRLVEVCLKLGETDEAVDYYTEYEQNAPGDSSKYILKYKIYKAKRAPVEDLIAILEEYKSKEYTERWAYELARLYQKAGMKEKCVEECDDLILWFSEGKYVVKAMELKMAYESLTPSQQAKYDNRDTVEENEPETPKPVRSTKKRPSENTANTEVQPDLSGSESLAEAEAAVASQPQEESADGSLPYAQPGPIEPEKLQEKLASSLRDVLSGIHKTKELLMPRYEDDEEEEQLEAQSDIDYQSVKELEPESFGNTTVLPAEKLQKIRTQEPENPEPAAVSEEEPAEKDDVLRQLLEETASQMAQQITTGEFQKEEETPAEEETAAPEVEIQDESVPEKEEVSDIEPQNPEGRDMIHDLMAEGFEEEDEEETAEETAETEDIRLEESIIAQVFAEDEEPKEAEQSGDTQEFSLEDECAKQMILQKVSADESEPEKSIEERILEEETPEERRTRILNDTRPEKLSDEQKKLFTYFAKVPGMDEQILNAMAGVYNNAGDKTSKRGNIAVMGRPGSGKTRLTDSLLRAICKDLGLEAVKMARIDGEAFNEKDPIQVVGKLAGGFLLIEHAGGMSDDTIDQLSRALSFRTDSLVLIIEDEKTSMRSLLNRHPDFARKFDAVISIPVFTNDELVTFARTYAREQGYKIDELGVLALYTRIGEKQTDEEPMTVASVKEMIDYAISKAHRGKIGRKVSSRRLDPEGRIILFEKDFDF